MHDNIYNMSAQLENGTTIQMQVEVVDPSDWEEIERGKRGVLRLVNDEMFLIFIESADEEGISFKIDGFDRVLHYDSYVIKSLFIECS